MNQNNLIRGICHTNLDDYKQEKFPEYFVVVPRIGEHVQSENGKRLKVVSITHCWGKLYADATAYIKVELHK